jgi:hypothetical protein
MPREENRGGKGTQEWERKEEARERIPQLATVNDSADPGSKGVERARTLMAIHKYPNIKLGVEESRRVKEVGGERGATKKPSTVTAEGLGEEAGSGKTGRVG